MSCHTNSEYNAIIHSTVFVSTVLCYVTVTANAVLYYVSFVSDPQIAKFDAVEYV